MKFASRLICALLILSTTGCGRSDRSTAESETVGTDNSTPTGTAGELYTLHCAACHGEMGDGQGVGARTVFPSPRNFRAGWFRLVSSPSLKPTAADIERVISRGMPGSSMPAFEKVNAADRRLLAEHVLSLWREGVRQRLIAELASNGEQATEDEIEELVDDYALVDDKVNIPAFGSPSSQSIETGKAIYFQQSCQSCHGKNGMGDWDVSLFDNEGELVRPRDLVHESFKGGQEPDSIYMRILLGMPGSPHPSNANLSQSELMDLVHFVRSIGADEKIVLTGYQRRLYASSRVYLRSINQTPPNN